MDIFKFLLIALASAGSTTVLAALLVWLFKSWITVRLTKSVQHEYDKKHTNLRSELTRQEESFRAALHERSSSIERLSKQVFSGMSHQHNLLFQKRIEGIDAILESIELLGAGRVAAEFLSSFRLNEINKSTTDYPKIQKLFKTFADSIDDDDIKSSTCYHIRPYVSPMCWASFKAYRGVIMYGVSIVKFIPQGFDMTMFDEQKILNLAQVALPDYSKHLEKHGASSALALIEKLEVSVHCEIQKMLDGTATDQKELSRAASILTATQALTQPSDALLDNDNAD